MQVHTHLKGQVVAPRAMLAHGQPLVLLNVFNVRRELGRIRSARKLTVFVALVMLGHGHQRHLQAVQLVMLGRFRQKRVPNALFVPRGHIPSQVDQSSVQTVLPDIFPRFKVHRIHRLVKSAMLVCGLCKGLLLVLCATSAVGRR